MVFCTICSDSLFVLFVCSAYKSAWLQGSPATLCNLIVIEVLSFQHKSTDPPGTSQEPGKELAVITVVCLCIQLPVGYIVLQ